MRRSIWVLFIFTLSALLWQRWSSKWDISVRGRGLHSPFENQDSLLEKQLLEKQQEATLRALRKSGKVARRQGKAPQARTKTGSMKQWSLEELQSELAKKQKGVTHSNTPAKGVAQKATVRRKLTKDEQAWLKEATQVCAEITDIELNRECMRSHIMSKKAEKEAAQAKSQRENAAPSTAAQQPNPINSPIQAAGTGLGPAGYAQGIQGTEEDLTGKQPWDRTLEEWETLILSEPNFGLTTLFIHYYDSQLISPSIFYPVVSKMTHDSRLELQKLGILALSSSPSYQSFVQLVQLDLEKGLEQDIRTAIRSALETYLAQDHTHYLVSVIGTSTLEPVKITALQLVDRSAPSLIAKPKTMGRKEGDVTAQTITRTVRQFEQILLIIQTSLKDPTISETLKASLNQTQEILERLLSQPQIAGL